ncbi:MAG: hypothetical protein AAGA68_13855 [Pseudomonadota bacterium]
MKSLKYVLLATGVLATGAATAAAEAPGTPTFPFARFLGDWTLQDDRFLQVWDGKTLDTLTIPGHFTHCAPVNTHYSVLCAVDAGGGLNGHILWVIGEDRRSVRHLSHFGDRRVGVGQGVLEENGDLTLTIRFEDEPAGTYRRYRYRWLDVDRYEMLSVQFDSDERETGNWYGGTFVRVEGGTAQER